MAIAGQNKVPVVPWLSMISQTNRFPRRRCS